MTTYSSPAFALNYPKSVHGQAGTTQNGVFLVTTTAALTTADTFNFGYLPPNAVVTGMRLKYATALDTGGTPTLTINVGIAGTAQLFYVADTTGRAGGTTLSIATAGALYQTPQGVSTAIVGSVGANAATGAAGTIQMHVSYVVIDSPTSP